MVAYAPYVAGTASLSSLYYASSQLPTAHNACQVATVTVYQYAEAVATIEALPTTHPTVNAHGHGGPYYNPYNDLPLPYNFPGQPTDGEIYAPEKPSPPFVYGGPAKEYYDAPAWIPKGYDKLVPSLPKGKQNGKSYWGDINCPHLPVIGLPGGRSYSSSSPSSVAYPPYPSVSASPSYSMISTNSSGSTIYGTGVTASTSYSSTSTPTPACPTMPDTSVTRTYDLHVAYQTIAPDGVTRNGLTINGQFPGPLVEANWCVFDFPSLRSC